MTVPKIAPEQSILDAQLRHRPAAAPPKEGDAFSVDLDLLDENPFQPRVEIDSDTLNELAASIAQSGLVQPIAVRSIASGRYQIVAGHRRVAAFRKLREAARTETETRKYAIIRAHVVGAVDDASMAIAAFVENAQRENLNAVEEAAALVQIKALAGVATNEDLSKLTGQKKQRVQRLVRLNGAPKVIKDAMIAGILVSAGSASRADSKRERRKLDLMAALEFLRLFEHFAKHKPTTAEERTATAISRALADNWSFRRIVSFVSATADTDEVGDTAPSNPRPTPPIHANTEERFVLLRRRLDGATTDQLVAAREELAALVADIEARIAARSREAAMENQH